MPWAAGLFAVGGLAAMGLPGLAVFVSEFMSIMGGYEAYPVQGFIAALGVLLSAVYLLYMMRNVIYGPITNPAYEDIKDANTTEMAAIVPLSLLLLILGFFPALLIGLQQPAVQTVVGLLGGNA